MLAEMLAAALCLAVVLQGSTILTRSRQDALDKAASLTTDASLRRSVLGRERSRLRRQDTETGGRTRKLPELHRMDVANPKPPM